MGRSWRLLVIASLCLGCGRLSFQEEPSPDAAGSDGGSDAAEPRTADPVSLSTGAGHRCLVRGTGETLCWGANDYGQLGDGTTVDRDSPVRVIGLAAATLVVTPTIDDYEGRDLGWFTCALSRDGAVSCWGRNTFGQLGDGTTTNRSAAAPVAGLTDAVDVDAGSDHACAVRADGTARCWGRNRDGQLGDSATIDSANPVAVVGVNDAVQVATGHDHSCVRRAAGQVACWGNNDLGALGDGIGADSPSAVSVVGIDDAVDISAGAFFSCAARASGRAQCWGRNGLGELGDDSGRDSNVPVDVHGITDAVQVSGKHQHACLRRATGDAACWGGGGFGELGDGLTMASGAPVVVLLRDIEHIAAGDHETCAIAAGSIYCWGRRTIPNPVDGRVDF